MAAVNAAMKNTSFPGDLLSLIMISPAGFWRKKASDVQFMLIGSMPAKSVRK
jgi:hypothetical protein